MGKLIDKVYTYRQKEAFMNRESNKRYGSDTVLIVEDTAANSEIIETFLDDINVGSEKARDGMEAVTMCGSMEDDSFSLILMDINLPRMSGMETARRIRSLGVNSPIIAVTASDKRADKIHDEENLFSALLFKPFNYLEFYTAISPYIRNAMAYTSVDASVFSGIDAAPDTDPAICDINRAISNMGNNPRLFIKHFRNFKRNNVDLSVRLRGLIESGDIPGAAALCHSVKGLSGMLGLGSLYEHVSQLEDLLSETPPFSEKHQKVIYLLLSSVREDIRSICRIQL